MRDSLPKRDGREQTLNSVECKSKTHKAYLRWPVWGFGDDNDDNDFFRACFWNMWFYFVHSLTLKLTIS